MSETVYIGLGSNLGDREQFLSEALSRMEQVEGLEIVAISALYLTRPQEMPDGSPPFLNQVVKAEYEFTPNELLRALEAIEAALGRTDKGECMPRTIDLDILICGDRQIETEILTIPHPELVRRPFVLVPLLQIDPDLVHPVSGKPLSDLLTAGGRAQVKLYKDHVARQV
jgi:2-amino-4-hydroxy-6-hydroxymethyldihydropteridine diphosphokinase